MKNSTTRRKFLSTTCASAIALGSPTVLTASRTDPLWNRTRETIIGSGEFRYRVDHTIAQLPDKFKWDFTHNVAVDSASNFYVIHEGNAKRKDHPSIFVFDRDGKFIRAFGSQFAGGGHGIEVRKEGKTEFLYVAAYQQVKAFAKMTLSGETVWYKKAPMESGVYAKGQDVSTKRTWNRQGFLPTNFTFLDDGGFLLADGYGSFFIHQFDKNANWVRCFGGPGETPGKFNTSHGLWIDRRPGRSEPSLVVTDRARNTLQRLKLDGTHLETITGFAKPANIDTFENLMLVSELNARLTLLDENNQVLVQLDEGAHRAKEISKLGAMPGKWVEGHFIAPHDACFDSEGNILVAERIPTGRISKLTRVK